MPYELEHHPEFVVDLARAHKKVLGAFNSVCIPLLMSDPEKADPPKVKKLHAFKNNLWRLRVSDDYRLVYHVDSNNKRVRLLMLGHRGTVYDRLGLREDGSPTTRIVASGPELLEKAPTESERGTAILHEGLKPQANRPDSALPVAMNAELLGSWAVPSQWHAALVPCKTEGDLLRLDGEVPSEVLLSVIRAMYPPPIEAVIQQPVHVSVAPEDLSEAASGVRGIYDFLLRLDPEQEGFVRRLSAPDARGPWLLKGGPGSGKSTMMLYCIRELVARRESQLKLGEPLKILVTTFTRALTNMAREGYRRVHANGAAVEVAIETTDALAVRHASAEIRALKTADDAAVDDAYKVAYFATNKPLGRDRVALPYLKEEVDAVVEGYACASLEEYLAAPRAGRGRRMSEGQRRYVWQVRERVRRDLAHVGLCLRSTRIADAARSATGVYDFVFVDEAQDLSPAAIRLCTRLAKSPSGILVAADTNQSIYGTALSWPAIAGELKFTGRAIQLRRNYRTTAEINAGVADVARLVEPLDRETLELECAYSGPMPLLLRYASLDALVKRLDMWLHKAIRLEGATPGGAAVICPAAKLAQVVAERLSGHLGARAVTSQQLDVASPGVKVITMHTAKGLEFPVVAVIASDIERLWKRAAGGNDGHGEFVQRWKRAHVVASSRAMRRLAFCVRKDDTHFAPHLSSEVWETEEV